jgi:hypothetical protein
MKYGIGDRVLVTNMETGGLDAAVIIGDYQDGWFFADFADGEQASIPSSMIYSKMC